MENNIEQFDTPRLDNRNAVRIEVLQPADGEQKSEYLLGFNFTAKHAIVIVIAAVALYYINKND